MVIPVMLTLTACKAVRLDYDVTQQTLYTAGIHVFAELVNSATLSFPAASSGPQCRLKNSQKSARVSGMSSIVLHGKRKPCRPRSGPLTTSIRCRTAAL